MGYLAFKYAITAALVVLISEVAKRSDKMGALIASLPLVTVLTLIWLYVEQQPLTKISNHAYYTFWYVLPTLPMFFMFPWFLTRFGFWPALLVSLLATALLFGGLAMVMGKFGVELLP